MAEELFIPKLGQTVEQVTLINWLVKDGDTVSQGQGVLEVETDKAVFTVEATVEGIIHLGPYKAGDVLPNLTVVAIIGKAEDQFTAAPTTAPDATAAMEAEKAVEPTPTTEQPELFKSVAGAIQKIFISPRAKKLADDKKVDTNSITPTGGMGMRIVEKDVRAFLEQVKEIKISPLAERVAQESGHVPQTSRSLAQHEIRFGTNGACHHSSAGY